MNEQTKEMTMEEKANFDNKKKEAAKAYAERKAKARKIILDFLASDQANRLADEVKGAILYISGSGVRSGRSGVVSELKALLLAGPVSSVDIFNKFEYGRPTMNQKINGFIKAKPEDRIWVEFKDGNYVVVGKGEKPPKGWTGFLPTVKEEL